jgi:PAS domain S-box-containing protein
MSALNQVLLIEDNPGDARLVSEYLRERFGASCALKQANSLATGLHCLQSADYDVVLLDLGLPDSTGLGTFFAVNSLAPGTPVIILTGDDNDDAGVEALHAGADDFLAKQTADGAALIRAMRHAVQRRGMATRLRESEARYRAIVETAEEGIIQISCDGTITVANGRAASLLCTADAKPTGGHALTGRLLHEFVEPDQAAALQVLVQMGPGQRTSQEIKLRREDGAAVWVVAAASRAATVQGATAALVLMLTDVTDSRLARAELTALQTDLEARVGERTASLQALNADLEAFSFSVAHDLRTPLNGILGFAALMQTDQHHPLPAPHQLRLQIIERSARGMDDLITGLLELARLGRQAMIEAPLDLSAMAQSIATTLQASEPGRAVQWQIDPVPIAVGDPRLVEVLLNNLLGNAWKYSAKAAPAAIRFGVLPSPSPSPSQTAVPTYFVRDNGIGFDTSDAGQLFTPFHRMPEAGAYVGSGVGLATVRRAAERHGGSVWAESQPGAGACFYFTLQPEPPKTVQP